MQSLNRRMAQGGHKGAAPALRNRKALLCRGDHDVSESHASFFAALQVNRSRGMLLRVSADIGAMGDFHIVLHHLPVERHLHEFGVGRFVAGRVEARRASGSNGDSNRI